MSVRFLFIFSGFLSLIIYCLILFFLIFARNLSVPIRYVPKIDTQIEQVIAIEAILEKSSKKDDLNEGSSALEGTGVRDIFSSISDGISSSKEIPDNRDEIAKNLELNKKRRQILEGFQDNIKNINSELQVIKNKSIDIASQTPRPDSSDGLYDEWFSKVYEILYLKWEISFYQDASVSVLLTITNNGDFSYKILRYSRYDNYNKSVEKLLKSLQVEKFPPYPKGKSIAIEVNFKTEGKR